MQKWFTSLIIALLITVCAAETIRIDNSETSVRVLDSNDRGLKLEFNFGQFEIEEIKINDDSYHKFNLKGEPVTFEEGKPELPFLARSIMIPEQSGVTVKVSDYESKEYKFRPVPSRGLILRTEDLETIPYVLSEMYNSEAQYPMELIETGEPYIMREIRGIVIKAYPFQYDPARDVVIVRHRMVVDVIFEGRSDINTLRSKPAAYCSDFEPLYSAHFLNFDRDRYTSVSEAGRILVIAHPDFMDAVQPYVDWKRQNGYETILISTAVAGTTAQAIKSTIYDYYTQGCAFVQLAGDAEQVAAPDYLGGGSDPTYALHVGTDYYPDLFVGRFSAETVDQLTTQVERSIHYERDLGISTWLNLGTGIASHEGDGIGDEGEADWVHMDGLRDQLLDYNYDSIDQFYATNGATATMVANALNSGRGILNYVGHGSANVWVTTGFSTAHVNNLVNDYKLPFIHSVACVNGDFVDNTCFAEEWLRATNDDNGRPTGAIAFYGSSINQSWAPPMEAQDEYINILVEEGKKTIGGLWYNGSCSMIDEYGFGGANVFVTWNIFGDASLQVRTDNPTAISASFLPLLSYEQASLAVATNSPFSRITLWKDGVIHGSGNANSSGNINLNLNPVITENGSYTLTITNFNEITYTGTLYYNDIDSRIWTGAVSTDWHNPANWYNSEMPNNSLNALIPSGLANYPIISSDFGTCQDLTIDAGASLTINSNTLFVFRNMYVHGLLNMNHASSVLMVAEELVWNQGGRANISNNGAIIICEGDVTFNQNSNVQMQMGTMQFNSDGNSFIINKTINTQLNNLNSNKTSPAYLAVSDESTQPLTINGNLVNFENCEMRNLYPGITILKGNLICNNSGTSGGIKWDQGTLETMGTSQNISFASSASYLNNLKAGQSGNLTFSNPLTLPGDLTVVNGSNIIIGDHDLTVENNAYLFGELVMNSAAGDLVVEGSINWEAGSTANITSASAEIYCRGNMFFSSSSNVSMTNGYIEFNGPGQSYIINNRSTTQINHLRSNKTAPGYLYIHSGSDDGFTINGSIWNYQNKTFYNEYTGTIKVKGNITNFNTNTDGFRWENGTLVLNGTNHTLTLPNSTDCVRNLSLQHSGAVSVSGDLRILGNIFMQSGTFNPDANIVYIGGNWTKLPAAIFTNTNSTVIFNGSEDQNVSSSSFNILRLNKSGGNLIVASSANVIVESYKYDLGTIEVTGGSFTVNDLADSNIKGNYILSDGTISLNQDESHFLDLDANLTISGGVFNIFGGHDFPADWAYTRDIVISMSGGILDWHNKSIGITNTGYTATLNLTGGTIRTQGSISIQRNNVHFTGGTIELYGSSDASVYHYITGSFNDLKINKTSGRDINTKERTSERSNTVLLESAVYVAGNILITSGTLDVNGNTLIIGEDLIVDGTLKMQNALDLLIVGSSISWNSTAQADVTVGEIRLNENLNVLSDADFQLGSTSTFRFTGSTASSIQNSGSNCVFGNVIIDKTADVVQILYPGNAVEFGGYLTLNSNNTLICNSELVVIGSVYCFNDSYLSVEGFGSLEVDGDISSSGLLETTGCSITGHGDFLLDAGGTLGIIEASVILDKAYNGSYVSINGNLIMSDDSFFEITNNGITFAPQASVSMGSAILSVGWNFRAINPDVFQPESGEVEFIGARNAEIQCNNGNYFNYITYNKPATTHVISHLTDIQVTGNLLVSGGNPNIVNRVINVGRDVILNGGRLSANGSSTIINVGRNWTNNGGIFSEGTSANGCTVNFIGSTDGTIGSENFYRMNINKSARTRESERANQISFADNAVCAIAENLTINSGTLRILNNCQITVNNDLVVDENHFTMTGTIPSTVTVNGEITLEEFGSINLGSTGNLITDSAFTQNGNLFVNGGSFTSHGNYSLTLGGSLQITAGSFTCDAPYADTRISNMNGEFILSGGVFESTHQPISFQSAGNNLISGGTIKTGAGFSVSFADKFAPTGGKFEFIGDNELCMVEIYQSQGNYFHDLWINKTSGSVYLVSETLVKGDIYILSGNLVNNENSLLVEGDWFRDTISGGFTSEASVHFVGAAKSIIKSSEQFYSLIINKSGNYPDNLEILENMQVIVDNITFIDGVLEMKYLSTLAIFSDLTLPDGCGILCSDTQWVLIALYGNFTDNNAEINQNQGFSWGNSLLHLHGTGNRQISAPQHDLYFNELLINLSPVGELASECHILNDNAEFHGDVSVLQGNLRTEDGARLVLHQDFYTNPGASLILPSTTLEFWGDEDSHFTKQGSGDIPTIKVTKSTTRSPENSARDNKRTTASVIADSFISAGTEIILELGILDVNGNGIETTDLTINPLGTLLMPEGSEVVMLNNGSINCHGDIISTGTETNPNAFYANGTDKFDFRVKNGGFLSAQWTSFSQFSTYYGLYFESGSEIDTETGLMNCSFYNGVNNASLIAFNNIQDAQIVNAHFPNNANGELYNVRKMNDAGSVALIGSTGDFSGEDYEYDPYDLVDWDVLEVPQNISAEIIGGNVRLQWNAVTGANSYKVFSSTSPDTEFTEDSSGVFNGTEWTAAISGEKRFYRIVAVKTSTVTRN